MTVEEAVRARILALSAVTALCSTRVYLGILPQGPTYPNVLVQIIDDAIPYHLRGPVGTKTARVQVDARARAGDAYGGALDVLEAIDGDGLGRDASGVAGFIGPIGSPAFEFKAVFPQSRRWEYDPEELRVVTMSRDYIVWFTE